MHSSSIFASQLYSAVSPQLRLYRIKLLPILFSPTLAGGDTIAIGAIRALNRCGHEVPEDIAVVGFDDIPLSSLFSPALTTVRQPQQQIGIRAVEMLLDQIAKKPLNSTSSVLNYELIIRESSGGYVGE